MDSMMPSQGRSDPGELKLSSEWMPVRHWGMSRNSPTEDIPARETHQGEYPGGTLNFVHRALFLVSATSELAWYKDQALFWGGQKSRRIHIMITFVFCVCVFIYLLL